MSLYRCGWCGAPSLKTIGLCDPDAAALEDLLGRLEGMAEDLAAAARKEIRVGERVTRSTAPGLPVNLDAVEARRALTEALQVAIRGVLDPRFPVLVMDDQVRLLQAHWSRVRESWVGPALLGDLRVAVPRAVSVLQPRGRLVVQVACPGCGRGPMRPAGGGLSCVACEGRFTVGEVRAAS